MITNRTGNDLEIEAVEHYPHIGMKRHPAGWTLRAEEQFS
jgi:hypothetical protein